MAEMSSARPFEFASQPAVRGFLHRPDHSSADALVLTHGAGANCSSPLLLALAEAFSESGFAVLRCDLPFRQNRTHGPPLRTAELDRAGLKAAVEALRPQVSGRIFLGGHSYGGRQATMLATEEPGLVPALLLLSYPLHPPKNRAQMRTGHFANLRTPAFFVHGSRDGFGTPEDMQEALRLIPARTQFLPVNGAGHELARKGETGKLASSVAQAFTRFVAELLMSTKAVIQSR